MEAAENAPGEPGTVVPRSPGDVCIDRPDPLQARNKLGAATRYGDADQIEDARRDLAAAKLSTYVARVVAEAPP